MQKTLDSIKNMSHPQHDDSCTPADDDQSSASEQLKAITRSRSSSSRNAPCKLSFYLSFM